MDFCDPHSKMSFGSLHTRCIDSSFHDVFNFTVLAAGAEVNVKEAIKLEMEQVFQKMVVGTT
jgi:hypothetical protein